MNLVELTVEVIEAYNADMNHNYPVWRRYIEGVIFAEIEVLERFYSDRTIPAFADLSANARQVTKEAWERMMNTPVPEGDADPSVCAEEAQEEGLDWYLKMKDLQSRMNGLFCVTLYSQIERFLALLLTRELLPVGCDLEMKNWGQLCRAYESAGIKLEELATFDEADLLRLVNNASKHGEGQSLDELRSRVPDMVAGDNILVEDSFVTQAFGVVKCFVTQLTECLNHAP